MFADGASYFESQNPIGLDERSTGSHEGGVSLERRPLSGYGSILFRRLMFFKVNCVEYDSGNFGDFPFRARRSGLQTWIAFTLQAVIQSAHPM